MPSLERDVSLPLAEGPDEGAAVSVAEHSDRERRQSRTYWRSVERLLDSPALQQDAGRAVPGEEFPTGASDSPEGVDRRTMLGIMGASFAMSGLVACRRPVETIVPYVDPPETVVPGVPRQFATTVSLGTSAYGVVVESHENRPTKVEGNALHPSSGGAADAWTQASVLGLYDPDRSHSVLERQAAAVAAGGEDGHGEDENHGDESHGEEAGGAATVSASSWAAFETFWAEKAAEFDASGGAGLAVLLGAYSSPTVERLRQELTAKYPSLRLAVWEPIGDGNSFAGCELATGQRCRPVYDFETAQVIVSLEADFLGIESESVRHSRGFARGRRVESPSDEMNRLYAVESSLSITGSMADHRVRLESRRVASFAAAVAAALGVSAPAAGTLDAGDAEKARLVAEDLRRVGANGLVLAGRSQPPEVHALALAINAALGALGTTVTLSSLADADAGDAEQLAELVEAMTGGGIDTLFVLGGNPVYDAPADLDFAGALAGVPHVVHHGLYDDETAGASGWHLPAAHAFEAWGDARAADGTYSVAQPLIAPLFDGRSVIEILALLARGEAVAGAELVKETRRAQGGDDTGVEWRRILHDGLEKDSASTALEGAAIDVSGLSLPTVGDGMELTFQPSRTTFDGRFANNGWLQEMPDSLTKITWDNAVLVSPATSAELDLETGDKVQLKLREASVEGTVFLMPGQADSSVAVVLGYGRTAAGRVGDGVGFDAYRLRHKDGLYFDSGLTVERVKGRYALSQTQEHWDMGEEQERYLVREATLEEYREGHENLDKVFGLYRNLDPKKSHQLFPEPVSYEEGPQWGMTIDLSSCTGCNACVIACQSENNVPIVGPEQVAKGREMHWLRVDRYFVGDLDEPEVVFQPVPCMHCENAPCEQVCPVAATVHDDQGINAMVYNRCIGTRYCSNNCPYKVRRFNFFNYTKDTPELVKMAMNPDVTVRSRGVMEKCSFCLQRISAARIAAKHEDRPVADGEVQTACQQTCPSEAILFGDIRDPESQVVAQKGSDRDYVLLSQLNNRPRTSYEARMRNPNPEWGGGGGSQGEAGA